MGNWPLRTGCGIRQGWRELDQGLQVEGDSQFGEGVGDMAGQLRVDYILPLYFPESLPIDRAPTSPIPHFHRWNGRTKNCENSRWMSNTLLHIWQPLVVHYRSFPTSLNCIVIVIYSLAIVWPLPISLPIPSATHHTHLPLVLSSALETRSTSC